MNKSILGLVVLLALIVPSTALADSYQHFKMGTPFNLSLKPHDTLYINNDAGKINQLIVQFPNATSKIVDAKVGNNGATSITVVDEGQYTFYGVDGIIGYAKVAVPQLPLDQPQQTIVANMTAVPSNQTSVTNNTTSTNQTSVTNQTQVVTNSVSVSSAPTSTPTVQTTNQTNATVAVQTDPTIIERLNVLEQTNRDLVAENAQLAQKIDNLSTQQLGMFGLLTKIAHSLGITGT